MKRLLTSPLVAVVVCSLWTSLPAARARACIALVQEQGGLVEQGAQVAVLSVHDDVTDHVFVLDVPAAGNAFGVLIPVAAEPTLDPNPVSTDAIDALEEGTRPTVLAPDPDADDAGGCGCGEALGGDALNSKRGIDVGDPVAIGPVTAQWVSGAQGDAIVDWLTDNGFVLPAGAEAVVDDYASRGMSFLAFKRNDTSTGAARVGVKFSLPGDRRAYALGMAQIGAAEEMAFTIFVATSSDQPVAPDAPFTELSVDDLGFVDDYRAAVRSAVDAAGGDAFVVETFGAAQDLAPAAAALFFDGAYVTRLSTVADPAGFSEDVTFTATATRSVHGFAGLAEPSTTPWRPRLDLSLSFLFLALLVRGALTRRARALDPVRA